jgi:hypothetical protein
MDLTFLLLRWLVVFTAYFLIGLSVGSVLAFLWVTWKEKKASKEFMKHITSKRK